MCSMDKMEAGTISSQDADARSASSVPTGNPSGTQRSSISPELSSKLTTVSFFAAVGVVLIHAHPPFSQAGQSDLSLLFERFLSGPFTSSAVPIFFVISGYLLAVKTDFGQQPHWYSLTIKKRIKSLLVPYILWNIIHVLTISLVKMLENIHAGRPMLLYTGLYEPLLSFGNLVRIFGLDLGKPPIEGVLWFVRNLLILFLISPLFMFFMKRRRTAFFFLLFLLVAEGIISYFITLNHGKLWAGCRLESLLFFSLGMYLAFYPVPHAISRAFRLVLPVFWLTIAFTAALHFPYKHLAITNSFLAYDSDRSRGDMASPRPVSGAPSNRQMEHSEGFFLPLCFSLYHTGNLPVSECGECFGAETAHSGFRDFLPQVSDPSHLFSVDRRGAETFSAESVPDPCRWTVVSPTRPSRSRCNPFRPPPDPDTAAAKH